MIRKLNPNEIDKLSLNFLEELEKVPNFNEIVNELLKRLFEGNLEGVDFKSLIAAVKIIRDVYFKIVKLNGSFIEIYLRLEMIQQKYKMELPTRKILPFSGLLLQSNDRPQELLYNHLI